MRTGTLAIDGRTALADIPRPTIDPDVLPPRPARNSRNTSRTNTRQNTAARRTPGTGTGQDDPSVRETPLEETAEEAGESPDQPPATAPDAPWLY